MADPRAWPTSPSASAGGGGRRVDGLVNAAGITRRARLHDVTPTTSQQAFAVNAVGPALGIQALAPLMRRGARS